MHKLLMPALVAGFFSTLGPVAAFAGDVGGGLPPVAQATSAERPDRGWFWYEVPAIPEEAEEPEAERPSPAAPAPQKPPEQVSKEPPPCTTPKTWSPSCGFVDPGEDFDFQALQRDELLKQMSVKQNDPEAVEAFQRYIKWVMGRASEVANLWYYNMVQNPDLDPSVTSPVSSFGLDLASRVKTSAEKDLFAYLGEVGKLIYFSRDDCPYCHQMAPALRELSREVGMPVSNVAIDGVCLEGYAECESGEMGIQAAQVLQVTVVPALFLYVEPDTWIRVSTGLTDAGTIKARVAQFFTSYRHAMLKGIDNGSAVRPAQDGSYQWRPEGTAQGVSLPSPGEMENLLKSP